MAQIIIEIDDSIVMELSKRLNVGPHDDSDAQLKALSNQVYNQFLANIVNDCIIATDGAVASKQAELDAAKKQAVEAKASKIDTAASAETKV